MRKTAEVLGLMVLAYLYWLTYSALHGPEPLPSRVPTHFNISGIPDGWGSPQTLWILPAVGSGIYVLFTVLASLRFSRYRLPVQVTRANLPYIQRATSDMMAWIKTEILCLFAYIQGAMIRGARLNEFRLSPAIVPVFMVGMLATVGICLFALIRGARIRSLTTPDQPQAE